ncbi:MAG TPA: hypothetical protein VD978_28580 [Azospirillum sp.]|nr:hypothetical protein [Azospirillum sp.]
MTDQAISASEYLVENKAHAEHRGETPLTFLGLALLLIMPLGIIFHPEWLGTLAEVGTLVAGVTIVGLTRQRKA